MLNLKITGRKILSRVVHGAFKQAAILGSLTGLSEEAIDRRCRENPNFIRSLNYHEIGEEDLEAFENQLEYFKTRFVDTNYEGLLSMQQGKWSHDRPGIMLTFDDGHRSHAELVAPLLEKHGFTGWFMLPAQFISAPKTEQGHFAQRVRIGINKTDPSGRCAMTWEQAKTLTSRHVIGCHTMSHCRLTDQLTEEQYQYEIVEARRFMEEKLGESVPVFCWVGGEKSSYSKGAADAIRRADFKISLMTNSEVFRPGDSLHHVHRTNCEATHSPELVALSLSGFFDVRYALKRNYVNNLTRA